MPLFGQPRQTPRVPRAEVRQAIDKYFEESYPSFTTGHGELNPALIHNHVRTVTEAVNSCLSTKNRRELRITMTRIATLERVYSFPVASILVGILRENGVEVDETILEKVTGTFNRKKLFRLLGTFLFKNKPESKSKPPEKIVASQDEQRESSSNSHKEQVDETSKNARDSRENNQQESGNATLSKGSFILRVRRKLTVSAFPILLGLTSHHISDGEAEKEGLYQNAEQSDSTEAKNDQEPGENEDETLKPSETGTDETGELDEDSNETGGETGEGNSDDISSDTKRGETQEIGESSSETEEEAGDEDWGTSETGDNEVGETGEEIDDDIGDEGSTTDTEIENEDSGDEDEEISETRDESESFDKDEEQEDFEEIQDDRDDIGPENENSSAWENTQKERERNADPNKAKETIEIPETKSNKEIFGETLTVETLSQLLDQRIQEAISRLSTNNADDSRMKRYLKAFDTADFSQRLLSSPRAELYKRNILAGYTPHIFIQKLQSVDGLSLGYPSIIINSKINHSGRFNRVMTHELFHNMIQRGHKSFIMREGANEYLARLTLDFPYYESYEKVVFRAFLLDLLSPSGFNASYFNGEEFFDDLDGVEEKESSTGLFIHYYNKLNEGGETYCKDSRNNHEDFIACAFDQRAPSQVTAKYSLLFVYSLITEHSLSKEVALAIFKKHIQPYKAIIPADLKGAYSQLENYLNGKRNNLGKNTVVWNYEEPGQYEPKVLDEFTINWNQTNDSSNKNSGTGEGENTEEDRDGDRESFETGEGETEGAESGDKTETGEQTEGETGGGDGDGEEDAETEGETGFEGGDWEGSESGAGDGDGDLGTSETGMDETGETGWETEIDSTETGGGDGDGEEDAETEGETGFEGGEIEEETEEDLDWREETWKWTEEKTEEWHDRRVVRQKERREKGRAVSNAMKDPISLPSTSKNTELFGDNMTPEDLSQVLDERIHQAVGRLDWTDPDEARMVKYLSDFDTRNFSQSIFNSNDAQDYKAKILNGHTPHIFFRNVEYTDGYSLDEPGIVLNKAISDQSVFNHALTRELLDNMTQSQNIPSFTIHKGANEYRARHLLDYPYYGPDEKAVFKAYSLDLISPTLFDLSYFNGGEYFKDLESLEGAYGSPDLFFNYQKALDGTIHNLCSNQKSFESFVTCAFDRMEPSAVNAKYSLVFLYHNVQENRLGRDAALAIFTRHVEPYESAIPVDLGSAYEQMKEYTYGERDQLDEHPIVSAYNEPGPFEPGTLDLSTPGQIPFNESLVNQDSTQISNEQSVYEILRLLENRDGKDERMRWLESLELIYILLFNLSIFWAHRRGRKSKLKNLKTSYIWRKRMDLTKMDAEVIRKELIGDVSENESEEGPKRVQPATRSILSLHHLIVRRHQNLPEQDINTLTRHLPLVLLAGEVLLNQYVPFLATVLYIRNIAKAATKIDTTCKRADELAERIEANKKANEQRNLLWAFDAKSWRDQSMMSSLDVILRLHDAVEKHLPDDVEFTLQPRNCRPKKWRHVIEFFQQIDKKSIFKKAHKRMRKKGHADVHGRKKRGVYRRKSTLPQGDFYDAHLYQPGDELNRIDWNATARNTSAQVIVRDPEREEERSGNKPKYYIVSAEALVDKKYLAELAEVLISAATEKKQKKKRGRRRSKPERGKEIILTYGFNKLDVESGDRKLSHKIAGRYNLSEIKTLSDAQKLFLTMCDRVENTIRYESSGDALMHNAQATYNDALVYQPKLWNPEVDWSENFTSEAIYDCSPKELCEALNQYQSAVPSQDLPTDITRTPMSAKGLEWLQIANGKRKLIREMRQECHYIGFHGSKRRSRR